MTLRISFFLRRFFLDRSRNTSRSFLQYVLGLYRPQSLQIRLMTASSFSRASLRSEKSCGYLIFTGQHVASMISVPLLDPALYPSVRASHSVFAPRITPAATASAASEMESRISFSDILHGKPSAGLSGLPSCTSGVS